MRPLLQSIAVFFCVTAACCAHGNQWLMSRPTGYTFLLTDSTVLTLKRVSKEIRAHIDSVGLRSAEITFGSKEILILEYDNGRLIRMRMRDGATECAVPDSIVVSVAGMQFSRTMLTWPPRSKRTIDPEHYCLHLNSNGADQEPARYPEVIVCFRRDCSRIGPLEVLGDGQ